MYVKEVERPLEKKVKIIRSNRVGEYSEKFNESGICAGPFEKLQEEYGIYAQYTMPGTSQQNNVA